VRPEKLRLSREQPDGTAIAATVASVNYQGGVSIVHATTVTGFVLKAQVPSGGAAAFERSTRIWAGWDPVDAVVLTQ
jgi:hypothetical protein